MKMIKTKRLQIRNSTAEFLTFVKQTDGEVIEVDFKTALFGCLKN